MERPVGQTQTPALFVDAPGEKTTFEKTGIFPRTVAMPPDPLNPFPSTHFVWSQSSTSCNSHLLSEGEFGSSASSILVAKSLFTLDT